MQINKFFEIFLKFNTALNNKFASLIRFVLKNQGLLYNRNITTAYKYRYSYIKTTDRYYVLCLREDDAH